MKLLVVAMLCLAFTTSASAQNVEIPQVNIPPQLWKRNWAFTPFQGSCVHASAIMLWRWQGQYEWAEYWGKKYYHGEYASRFHAKCDAEGVTYCDTYDEGDESHLYWAIRTRRGAVVAISNGPLYGYHPTPKNPTGKIAHAVCLVHLDNKVAGILDNNDTGPGPGVVKFVDAKAFLEDWHNSGSWAWTPVSTPPAPPQLIRKGSTFPVPLPVRPTVIPKRPRM